MGPSLILIPLLAVLAPLAARGLGKWVRVPVVVFELMLGIAVGPSVLGWAEPSAFVDLLSEFGLAMLFFVAGTEIQFSALRGRTVGRAIAGWLISIVGGVTLGWIVAPGEAAIVIGVALSSTALGTLLPILRDANELSTPFGRSVGAIGAVGEFGPLVAVSVFLGGRQPGVATIVLGLFILLTASAVWFAYWAPRGALHRFIAATLHTSSQFAIRIVLLILTSLVLLSSVLDIDILLGAFAAGIVWRLMMRDADEEDRRVVDSKIEAVAFGFLIPIFFIYTGVTFDLASLLAQPVLLLLVPVALAVLLVVRGVPSLLAAPADASRREKTAVLLMGATGLPIIVAVTAIGVDRGFLPSAAASVLVGAGMLSVLLFPLIATSLRGERISQPQFEDDEL